MDVSAENLNSIKLLAIETTGTTGSIVLEENEKTLLFSRLPSDQRSAQSLIPSIHAGLQKLNWSPADLNYIAVAVGPGSFTGLRIGLVTAKMLAWSLNCELAGINALQGMVAELKDRAISQSILSNEEGRIISAGLDAQRGDVAVQRFWIDSNPNLLPIPLEPAFRIIPALQWLDIEKEQEDSFLEDWVNNTDNNIFKQDKLLYQKVKKVLNEKVYYCGPVLMRWSSRVSNDVRERFSKITYDLPTARGMAQIAWTRVRCRQFDDIWKLQPLYSRKSAAEEKLEAKQNCSKK